MVCNLLWLGILVYAIRTGVADNVLTAIIYTSGATQTLYLGGQSAIDAWVRGQSKDLNHKSEQQET